jgi:acetyl/propionyl-CoA carboxylase alpha subunit/acetyl-CoA carboxylase carboxyltransferase component/phosphopantetheinyl transferase (holo-ACP synthase)
VDAPGFERLAIVNRGEAAMRLIHAVHEFNRERRTAIRTIALVTTPDRHAMFVREADEAVDLGAPTTADPRDGSPRASYVDLALLEGALREARADAAWVGWGFVAEQPLFAELCERLGVVFVGPPPAAMRRLGDKISAKRLAESAGVAVVPWSGGPVEDGAAAREHARRLGYPLLVKASAGGGGRGIRRVDGEADLAAAIVRARAEALKAFGDGTVFLERLVHGARHLEVQIIADRHGTTWAVGARDCSVQRRYQKVLEESPVPGLNADQEYGLRAAAVRLAAAAGYQSAGTVEFLFDEETRTPWFMEVNARLQVEHPVTEMTTGLDLVKLQLHIARGGGLVGEPPASVGHAIEVRLNAEDADNDFAPAPGRIELLRLPSGPGVRVDRGLAVGDAIAPQFDSMIAKVIAHGSSRAEALARLERALAEMAVVVRGGTTNRCFLMALVARPELARGGVDNAWLGRLAAAGELVSRRDADLALLEGAIRAADGEADLERLRFVAAAARGRPALPREVGHRLKLRLRGWPRALHVRRVGPGAYRVALAGSVVDVAVERLNGFESWMTVAGRRHRVVSVVDGLSMLVEVDGTPHRMSRDDGGIVRAPAPAVVLAIAVATGDTVAAGQRLALLEAMKMEMSVAAPVAGRVREVLVKPNVQVDAGAPLFVIEALATEAVAAAADDISLERLRAPGATLPDAVIRQLLLGYDVDAREVRAAVGALAQGSPAGARDYASELALLELFADVQGLFEQHRPPDEADFPDLVLSAQEYVLTYLRTFDATDPNLPSWFVERLRRALAQHDVTSLERSPALDEALLRIWKAHQRVDEQVPAMLAVLERLAVRGANERAGDALRGVLDRVIALGPAAQPEVADLAREVRYRTYDRPLFEQARGRVYAEATARLDVLARAPAPDREQHMAWLASCPQPLVTLLITRFAGASPALRRTMLEVLTRRYYRIRELEGLGTETVNGLECATASYLLEGRRIHVVTTVSAWLELADVVRRLFPLLERVAAGDDVIVDLYLPRDGVPDEPDAGAHAVEALLDGLGLPRRLRRVALAIAGVPGASEIPRVGHFTFRPDADGRYREDLVYRGLHPMMGKRLDLWRLGNFRIERLPSVEDVYLFAGVARENPRDERLFAIAEVRDLTAVRDETGRVVALPHLERMLAEAVAAIRTEQSRRAAARRLFWNRILLYVRPPFDLTRDEIDRLVARLAPSTESVGLEKVVIRARVPDPETRELRDTVLHVTNLGGLTVTAREPADVPIRSLGEYAQKVVRLRRLGLTYPYEIIAMLTPAPDTTRGGFPPGVFVEHDLDAEGRLIPVERAPGGNEANIVVGVLRSFTARYPEGMTRVVLLGDPSRAMGALAEPECRRIIAALDLAERLGVPVEWFAVSAGAKISMESGTENMDWIAHVLRRIIEFTQARGELNVVVCGINVGAQPYWNAEATMLLHTRGILVMIAGTAMVLTGKRALEYSGSVSAEDNEGIGGYDRVMGPNGQAQYWAADLGEACRILYRHYEHAYVAPGERFPRPAASVDPPSRDVRSYPHGRGDGSGFELVGDVFSDAHNPGRKRPFDIRRVMAAVADQDHPPLERWAAMRDAEVAVVWDAHLGGWPVSLLGIESQPLPRLGMLPADGPDHWTAGTLFPRASKKVARAVNATSANRPLVILANLSGFDGSPESLRELQLEYGAEIGRAIVNFRGPIVFCVISRYHGGAYVVFSRALNPGIETAAVEGSYASVIGGAPAAAVVFAGEVDARTRKDARVVALEREAASATGAEQARRRSAVAEVVKTVYAEKLGEVADEFDRVHSVHRALRMGSLDRIIPAAELRRYLVDAVERGIRRTLATEPTVVARAPGLLGENAAHVPDGDEWLTAAERTVMAGLPVPPRRADWRLGRFTGKRAVGASLGLPEDASSLARIEIRADGEGAPEALVDGAAAPLTISLSHRGGRAVCAVARPGVTLGCDLELVEPRSLAFVDDFFTDDERRCVLAAPERDRPRIATLTWSAKESALKALRIGLRRDTRSVEVTFDAATPMVEGWSPVAVRMVEDQRTLHGWWRVDGDRLLTVIADPPTPPPASLAEPMDELLA